MSHRGCCLAGALSAADAGGRGLTPTLNLPFYQQAAAFWVIKRRFVSDYFELWYPDALAAETDAELLDFLLHTVGTLDATSHLLPLVRAMAGAALREFAINVVTRLIFAVTAHHEHYGGVSVYAQDVSFCSFAWPKGERCGTKTTAVTQATLMAATSFPMPPQMSQAEGSTAFTQSRFLRAPSPEAQKKLQAVCDRHAVACEAMERRCNEYVARAAERPFPWNHGLWCFNPRWMESSASV